MLGSNNKSLFLPASITFLASTILYFACTTQSNQNRSFTDLNSNIFKTFNPIETAEAQIFPIMNQNYVCAGYEYIDNTQKIEFRIVGIQSANKYKTPMSFLNGYCRNELKATHIAYFPKHTDQSYVDSVFCCSRGS